LRHRDHISRAALERRNVHALAVDEDAFVADDLTRFGARGAEAHAISHAVEPAFEYLQQRFAGHLLATRGFVIALAELALEQAVGAAHLLFFAKLNAVTRKAGVLLPVLSRRIVAALDRALVGEALFALEKQFLAFATALPAFCVEIPCHSRTPC
jgi:hypothetical protein